MNASVTAPRRALVTAGLVVALLAAPLNAPGGVTAAGNPKIAPDVAALVADGESAAVLVKFRGRANTAAAARLSGRVARIATVQRSLAATATSAQGAARALLYARRLAYQQLWIVNAIALTAGADTLADLAALPEVEAIVADRAVVNIARRESPTRAGEPAGWTTIEPGVQLHVSQVNADKAWDNHGIRGAGVVVGVLDTGAFWEHEALKGKYRGWNGVTASHAGNWHDATSVDGPTYSPAEPVDADGHGTHVTGVAVGGTPDIGIGVAPAAQWIACRAFEFFEAEISDLLECLQWLLAPTDQNGVPQPSLAPHIVNHSWGVLDHIVEIEQALNALLDAGIVQVAAAGNWGPFCASVTFPAVMPRVIAVGGVVENQHDIVAFFSGRGPDPFGLRGADVPVPDVVAPGEFVWSAFNAGHDEYIQMIGTSQATPIVSGVAALLLAAQAELVGRPQAVKELVTRTALPVTDPSGCSDSTTIVPNNAFGWGFVDALNAVDEIMDEGETGSIRIALDLLPDSGRNFFFGGDLGTFMLDDSNWPGVPNARTFGSLPEGEYAVIQLSDRQRWSLVGIDCTGGQAVDVTRRSVTIHVVAGEETSCTFRNALRRADALIGRNGAGGRYKGDNVYSPEPLRTQTVKRRNVAAGQVVNYWVAVQNDSVASDSFRLHGAATGSNALAVAYSVGGVDVTSQVVAGTFTTGALAPGAKLLVLVRVTVSGAAGANAKKVVVVRSTSQSRPAVSDVVRAVTRR